ncbi:hypothetical protein N9O19_05570 [Euryarchaeota archaeon]|nr:hypothetical protein [Euryarchaeota archaeon]
MNWENIIKNMDGRNRRTNKKLFSANQILQDDIEDDLRGHKGTKEALGKLIRSMEKKHPVKVTNLRFAKDLGKYKTFVMAELKITAKLRKYDEDTILVVARRAKYNEKLFRIDSIELAQSMIKKDERRAFADDDTGLEPFMVNPPKGNERIKIVKDIFSEVDDARDILQAASSWSSPETYERIERKLSELVKEIKALEKEALEYHSRK